MSDSNFLRPVGFGRGEPDFTPAIRAIEQFVSIVSPIVVINSLATLGARFFRSTLSYKTAAMTGLEVAVTYPLARKIIHQLPFAEKDNSYKVTALITLISFVSIATICYCRSEAQFGASLTFAALDLSLIHFLLER